MMTKKILVTYASRSGSTAEVAEAIGKTLAESGNQVDVIDMKEVKDLKPYHVIVAGSAIQKSKWLPEAMQFIQTQRAILAQKTCATFTVCITLAMSNDEKYRSAVAGWITPIRSIVKPVSEGLFAGRLDFSKLPLNPDTLLLRATVASGIFPKGDRRDWKAIRMWAEGLHSLMA
jgi:menaquinone-dependent protoporphyrinogen oxidase